MYISHPLKRGVVGVSAAISLLAVAPASHAGIIGSFDPQFGGNNPGLQGVGYQGTFDLNASNGCYGQANAYVFTGNGCTITVNSITVGFYDYAAYVASGATTPTFLQSYTLNAGTGTFATPGEQNYITGAYFDPTTDRLVSFDTVDSNAFQVSLPAAGTGCSNAAICYNGSMVLYFASGYPQGLPGVATEAVGVRSFLGSAYLIDCNTATTEGASPTCNRGQYASSNRAGVRITSDPGPLPEPETIPLALIGLGALALTRWRRRSGSARQAG